MTCIFHSSCVFAVTVIKGVEDASEMNAYKNRLKTRLANIICPSLSLSSIFMAELTHIYIALVSSTKRKLFSLFDPYCAAMGALA